MDILTHTLSGVAVATCAITFVKTKPISKVGVVLAGTLGGAFPDADAISMWSGFDSTLGRLFNLPLSGKAIYSSKYWYSHHAFFHSLIGSIFFGILFMLILYGISRLRKKENSLFFTFVKNKAIYILVFVLGFWAHLVGDLPTPSSAWGGIAFWWPSKEYVGGMGDIWWWNNYDIFLILVACIALNLVLPILSKYVMQKARIVTISILTVSVLVSVFQVKTRQFDYITPAPHAASYWVMEQNSKKEQQRILGKHLYRAMDRFDKSIKINF